LTTLPDTEQLIANHRELEDLYAADARNDAKKVKEEREANIRLIESVKPELTRLGNKWANAFLECHGAHLDFDNFIDALEDAGASVGQFRIRPNGLSHPKDRSGNYFYALQEFVDSGFLKTSNMPKAFV
jgi:hypothetical protein